MELCTVAVAEKMIGALNEAENALGNYTAVGLALGEARQVWAAFEHEVKASDPGVFVSIGRAWLELSDSAGTPAYH